MKKIILHDKVENFNLKLIVSLSFTLLFWLSTYSLNAVYERIQNPYINTTNGVEEYAGTFGDLIGGTLNPILALFGIVAAGLAFYAQYEANKQVQQQFRIQQIESQFYEMLHLHRENLNEMSIEGYIFTYADNDKSKKAKINSKVDKVTSGKKIFVTMLKEFEAIHLICTKVFMFKHNLLLSPQKDYDTKFLKQLILDHSYYVFFNGISLYKKNINRYTQNDNTGFLNLVVDDFVRELTKKRESHEDFGIKEYYQYYTTGNFFTNNYKTTSLKLSFNYKPFSGHQSRLAHYYRHLFQTVKFIAKQNQNLILYESKRDYLRVLRSMLSNHEQVLILYNWIGGFGSSWEQKTISKRKIKEGNYFFTDYRMIHNIPPQLLIDDYNLSEIFDSNFRNFLYERNRKEEDPLFELLNIISFN
ncbi:putative phage abortive infection protein [Flavobacterium aquidurense]|uniref:putative phage abortive infection protein n=1 Tax=Flavobacterium aquidurense TaxID=362413 RepID=UPI003712B7B5